MRGIQLSQAFNPSVRILEVFEHFAADYDFGPIFIGIKFVDAAPNVRDADFAPLLILQNQLMRKIGCTNFDPQFFLDQAGEATFTTPDFV